MCVVDNLPSTDHDAVHFMVNVVVPPQSSCKRILYNYKKVDMSVFLETLSHISLKMLLISKSHGSCLRTCCGHDNSLPKVEKAEVEALVFL